ncbi:ATP-dependent DNA helicase [Nitrospinaceae bacterium]|nr:ATP-dependent DNA helicase [Nitrospinaceae bacterium]
MIEKEVGKYLDKDGFLSDAIEEFERRPQQIAMAEAVGRAFDDKHHLIVEAGTGTGKSLAYLIPAILWAVQHNKKVVVSTYSKALQEQLLYHDIPLIHEKLKIPFRYALCLGHENYLSLRRLKRASQAGLFATVEEDEQMAAIFDWVGETQNGTKGDLPFEPLPSVWEDVGRQKDLCLGKNCETYSTCYYFKERKRWFSAHLLIVNHHLFFANVASNGAVLPRFDAVIFDEAQNIEESATSFLGLKISNSYLYYFLDRLYHSRTRKGLLSRIEHDYVLHLRNLVGVVRKAVETFFTCIVEEYGGKDRVLRLYKPIAIDNSIYFPMKELHESLKNFEGMVQSEEDRVEITSAANRCIEFNNAIPAFLNQHLDEYVYWLEITEKKRFNRVVLQGVPVNAAGELQEQVFSKIDRVVLTSATLTTHRGFEFIQERIGFKPQEQSILDSPFDYPSQALLYISGDLPEPSEEMEKYVSAMARRCGELVEISQGRTFILFTSYALMDQVYDRLQHLSSKLSLLRQGEIPTGQMIRRFKETPSVIFGTNSFWQGVDIPGDALKSVIITKLPFDVPSEPLTEARIEDLHRRSIDPFSHYQIPRAIIQMKQGFGRLIRKQSDTGVVSILDSRMIHRGYGKQFLDSLPSCEVVEDLVQVKNFFSKLEAKVLMEE